MTHEIAMNSVRRATPPAAALTDAEWVSQLAIKPSSHALKVAAQRSDVDGFAQALQQELSQRLSLKKGKRKRLLAILELLWMVEGDHDDVLHPTAEFATCLFDSDLTCDEFSQRVEAILCRTGSGPAQLAALCAGMWLLLVKSEQLSPSTLLALWRWCGEQLEACPMPSSTGEPREATEQLARLECLWLRGLVFAEMKGVSKEATAAARLIRQTLEEGTDHDGTPHASWLGKLGDVLSSLGRMSLAASAFAANLWTKKYQRLLEGLFDRTVVLMVSDELTIDYDRGGNTPRFFSAVATAMQVRTPKELRRLIPGDNDFKVAPLSRSQSIPERKLPASCHQSDWAEWACLRSGWETPADRCLVRFHTPTPEIDLVVSKTRLFAGAWPIQVRVNGAPIALDGEWSCVCWFVDREAAYLEIEQQHKPSGCRIVRHVLLLRQDSLLLLADSICLKTAAEIDITREVPVLPDWQSERDSATRELALCQASSRVRIVPLSSPQVRVDGSREVTELRDGKLCAQLQCHGRRAFSATVLDWSSKRSADGVFWQKLTVAEDGRMMTPEEAVGYQLQIGKKQWMLYHSLVRPEFPRTVMGLHTLDETVFARLDSQGDFQALVEVEN